MGINNTPVTSQEMNNHSIDASGGREPVSTSKPRLERQGSGSTLQDDMGYGDTDLSHLHLNNKFSPDESDKTPRSWTWGFKKLESLLHETKGAVNSQVVKFVGQHLVGTKLIFVVGKAGTGKTSILSELTDLDVLQPGKTLKRGTKNYRVCPCLIDDEQYLFVDTAGFGDPDREDIQTFKDSVSSLIAFGSFIEVVGVLYVIGNPGTRLDQQDVKTLHWLQCFCGPDFFRNLTVVTSFWDSYSPSSFRQAYARMQSLYEDRIIDQIFNPSSSERQYHGAYIYHHGVTGGNLTLESYPGLDYDEHREQRREELRNLIRRRYAERRYKPVKLQFMKEVERNVPFMETEAAKVLRAPAVGVAVNIVTGKCMIEGVSTAQEARPLDFGPTPNVTETSWTETILEWWEIVNKAARTFHDAHRQSAQPSTTVPTTGPTAGLNAGIFQRIRNWWIGL
jgi:hypothetical protein